MAGSMADSMRGTIDLNADLGEGMTDDEGLLGVVTSANVACGYHAGDEATMRRVCESAARLGVAVGAQVSYDDRENFGRVPLDVEAHVLRGQVADQVDVLSRIAVSAGTEVAYVKPHGALYNRIVRDEDQATAVLHGSGDLPVLGLPGSVFLDRATAWGRTVYQEGFPDRGYTPEGTLVPRWEPGALIEEVDAIVAQALDLARSVTSLCLHGDSPGAVQHAQAVRAALEGAGYTLRRFT